MRRRVPYVRHSHPVSENALGLALSAGGARGAYQVGCWRAFLDRGVTFGAVSGSSIGALNGALIAQGDWRSAYDFWMELTTTTIIKPEYERLRKLLTAAAWDLGLLLLPVPDFRVLRLLKYASAALRFHSERGALGVLREYGLLNIAAFKPLLEKYLDVHRILNQSTPLFVAVNGSAAPSNPLGQPYWFKLQDLGGKRCLECPCCVHVLAVGVFPHRSQRRSVHGRRHRPMASGQTPVRKRGDAV